MELLEAREPDFAYEGEMHTDSALDPELRARIFPHSRLEGPANVLVFTSLLFISTCRTSSMITR